MPAPAYKHDAIPRVIRATIDTGERHNAVHTTPCRDRIFRDYRGNRVCRGCGFSWSAAGWIEELKDRTERTKKERRHD